MSEPAPVPPSAAPAKPAGGFVSGLIDRAGKFFDPAKHIQKFHRLTGRWMPKGGRKPGLKKLPPKMDLPTTETATPSTSAENGAAGSPPLQAASASPEPAPSFADITGRADTPTPSENVERLKTDLASLGDNPTAETIIGIIQTGLMLIGEEEGILSDLEKQLLRPPLKRVMDKYNVSGKMLPAEVDLALALVGLVVIRLTKPKTATFVARCKHWIVQKLFEREGRKISAVVRTENPAPAK